MDQQDGPVGPREEYLSRIARRRAALAECDRRHNRLGFLRVVTVAAAAAVAYAAWRHGALSGWWLLLPGAVFFTLGGLLQRVLNDQSRLSRALAFYDRALERIEDRWAGTGESGARFLDELHLYAQDLDLFGDGSLFQLLSNARTRMGEETLAAWLLAPSPPETVADRQKAVVEIAPRIDLREDLAVLGEEARAGVHPEALAAWGERAPLLERTWFRGAAVVLSVFGAAAIVAGFVYLSAAIGLVDLPEKTMFAMRAYFLFVVLALGPVVWRFKKRTDRILEEVEESARDLALLAGVLRRLEAESFASPRLIALRAALEVEGRPASRRIAALNRLMELVDSRGNRVVQAIGPLLLWDLHLSYALEDWRRVSGPALRPWLSAVGEIEALSSLAEYAYEHPLDVFPEFAAAAESPCFEGEALCHPLLAAGAVVPNDVRLGGELRVLVVSGSNMSGKSTLLRTVGVSAALAQAGAPVRARRLRLSPLAVGASIRIQDSLQAGASRFYAEITRLRQIMEKTEAETPVLFLIDEFLHGTNSHDRRIGAEAIVRGLVERGAIGLITTHDLALAHIADTLAPRAANVHFEDHLEAGRMHFDYKMRPGVVAKSNAIELMRSVGLEV